MQEIEEFQDGPSWNTLLSLNDSMCTELCLNLGQVSPGLFARLDRLNSIQNLDSLIRRHFKILAKRRIDDLGKCPLIDCFIRPARHRRTQVSNRQVHHGRCHRHGSLQGRGCILPGTL